MNIDINRIKDDVSLWHAGTIQLHQTTETQLRELKQLRADLESREKSLRESQALNDKLSEDLRNVTAQAAARAAELTAAVAALTQDRDDCNRHCETMEGHPDVIAAAYRRAEAEARAAEAEAQRKRAAVEKLKPA